MAYQNGDDQYSLTLQNLAQKLHENGMLEAPEKNNPENLENGNHSNAQNGFIDIPDGIPEWKKEIYRRRNQKILEQEIEEAERKKDPFEGQPEWKKPLLRKKEALRAVEEEKERLRQEKEFQFTSSPRWHQELILRRIREISSSQDKQEDQ